MCDTFVVLPRAAAGSATILAKNSDREPGEAHQLVLADAQDHPRGGTVACTYISIPQVRRTHRVLLAKPYWMWGAEMGVNEHSVAIGNEAVFTRSVAKSAEALLGMDLLRLALERAASAGEAVEVITGLLHRHGQGGNAGHTQAMHYDNSYLIADRAEAWILETIGRDWVARAVAEFD